MPVFSYSLSRINEPTWDFPRTRINVFLTDLPKDTTSLQIFQQSFKKTFKKTFRDEPYL